MRSLASSKNLELVEDELLLTEVANLVELPIVLLGTFDESYLDLPPEIIRATIRQNQKCFVLKKKDNNLSNHFILVSNIDSSTKGKEIISGNARVVNARLADAQFFWQTDLHEIKENGFDNWRKKLNDTTFHHKLGTQGDRIDRITKLAIELVPYTGANEKEVERAVEICKTDLNSAVVGEFPQLQGVIGRIYSEKISENSNIAQSCQDHYKPQGPKDSTPTDSVSITVALADKIDMLNQFWKIDEKPTGSKDPFALRRAALGVIRIIIENKIDFDIRSNFLHQEIREDLFQFFMERLKVYWRDSGHRHDFIDAVIADELDNSIFISGSAS